MAVFTLWLFKCRIDNNGSSAVSGEQPNETVELRLRRFSRKRTLEETTFADQPIQVAKDVFPLPLHEFKADPAKYQIHLKQLLSSNSISAAVSKSIVEEILQYVSEHGAGGEKERIVTEVNGIIELKWTAVEIRIEEEEEEEEDQDPPEKEESEICSICLDELNGGKREEIQVPCGHVYHDLCIYHWLIDNDTCPLCQASLDVEDRLNYKFTLYDLKKVRI